jgi:hypothetical protein
MGFKPPMDIFLGGVVYQGTWNATTNSPALTSSVGTQGYYYVVSVAGSTNLDGITDWEVGDWAIFNGTVWQKVDNTDAGLQNVTAGERITIDYTDPLDPIINWVPTSYALRNTTGNIPALEEYTVCTAATGVELTLPAATTAGERHTIINRDTASLKISGTGGDAFGNKDVSGNVFIQGGEGMTFIADGTNTWLYQQDRTNYDFTTVVTGANVGNVATITVDNMFFDRVGNTVHFAGAVTIEEITPGALTTFTITVPKYNSSANFGNVYDLIGTGEGYNEIGVSMSLVADLGVTAALRAQYIGLGFGGPNTYVLHGSYKLL